MRIVLIYCFVTIFLVHTQLGSSHECTIPEVLYGPWFSLENGKHTRTELNATTMTGKGDCIEIKKYKDSYKLIFKKRQCYTCVQLLVRTVNVLDKIETSCIDAPDDKVSLEYICGRLNLDHPEITLFSENFVPVNCRPFLEGVWNFVYQNRFKFKGECKHPDAHIRSCPQAGSQFLTVNEKFDIIYRKCASMTGTFNGEVQYSCLGDWFSGEYHYLAVANTRESRQYEKYRCFLKKRDDKNYIGVSTTAECSTLKTVDESPEKLQLIPAKSETIEAGCRLPHNFSGKWIDAANTDTVILINNTHIIATSYLHEKIHKKTEYVCRQQNDSRIMMAKLTVSGCQKEYVCFDFVPQHHNIIRYRTGVPMITDNFDTVCSLLQFPNTTKYDLYLRKNPIPIRCPIAGKFNFTQKGDVLFETIIWGGVTLSPRPNTYCRENISDFSVCDLDQTQIAIDETYCISVDHRGRPVVTYSEPDYRMYCVAYWKENVKSYLITYDELDVFSKYRCWVYQKTDTNRILMSQAINSYCYINQNANSFNYTEGAAVHLDLQEYGTDTEHQCPMHFDDGINRDF